MRASITVLKRKKRCLSQSWWRYVKPPNDSSYST